MTTQISTFRHNKQPNSGLIQAVMFGLVHPVLSDLVILLGQVYILCMSKIANPHDSFFRETFSRREIATNFFREYLPEPIKEQVDLNSLTMSKDFFVDRDLRQHFSDLLYAVKYQQGDLHLYLLFEHDALRARASQLRSIILKCCSKINSLLQKCRIFNP